MPFEIYWPLKSADMGEEGVKNSEKLPTSFMDGPISKHNFSCLGHRDLEQSSLLCLGGVQSVFTKVI